MAEKTTIEGLSETVAQVEVDHVLVAMKNGLTIKITLGQILDLIKRGDLIERGDLKLDGSLSIGGGVGGYRVSVRHTSGRVMYLDGPANTAIEMNSDLNTQGSFWLTSSNDIFGLANGIGGYGTGGQFVRYERNNDLLRLMGGLEVDSFGRLSGVLHDDTTTTTQAQGDNTNAVASTEYVDRAVAAGQTIIESGELSVAAGDLVAWTHGLGVRPSIWQAVLRCNASENGFYTGDEIPITHAIGDPPAGSVVYSVGANDTELWLSSTSNAAFTVSHPTKQEARTLNLNNWALVFYVLGAAT